VVFWSAFRAPKHHLRSKPSIHVRLRGKIKLVWSRSEDTVSKYSVEIDQMSKNMGENNVIPEQNKPTSWDWNFKS
jgi:hypothetical protein